LTLYPYYSGCGPVALPSCKTAETMMMSTHALTLHPHYSKAYLNNKSPSSSKILVKPSLLSLAD
jgi:hypothetical protein